MTAGRVAAALAISIVVACLANEAAAHPVHASFAEVEFNPKSRVLEVALEVDARDLEVLLKARAGRPVDLEKTADLDKLIVPYLRRAFAVRVLKTKNANNAKNAKKKNPPSNIRWVGMELPGAKAVLYFTVPLGRRTRNLVLENRVFFDLDRKQVNTVELRTGDKRTTLTFTVRQPRHPLKLR